MNQNPIRIAFFDTKPYDQEYFEAYRKQYGIEMKYFPVRLSADTARLAAGFQGVCAFVNDEIDGRTADILWEQRIPLIALRCAGYNNVDLKAVWGQIHVVRVPAYSPHAVAEHTVALLLSLNRKIHRAYIRTREGNFSLAGLVGMDLFGKTAGIFGTGQIGRISAEILRGFGMEVIAHDPFPQEEWAREKGVRYVSREELLERSDVITLHCPLTPENYHLIDHQAIQRMKKGAIVINTGRGALIDTKALIQALKSNKLGGAALDVYEEEDEYFFEDHSDRVIQDDILARLLTFPNVLITGHQAFFTREALQAIAHTTLSNIQLFFTKGELPNEICYQCTQKTCARNETGRCF
ncbi:MAG: 2-hydroxyacid dehydrogenase [Spirochaetales bacterium]